jgi:oxygen-independent coproporphyrinogen-3 oxidase
MRLMRGLNERELQEKFPVAVYHQVSSIMSKLMGNGWVQADQGHWSLTREGLVISNKVFQELTFLKEDV